MPTFIIGAGIWGLTMARLIAELRGERVVVVDRRGHIGGNSHSEFDPETGIECHKYGSHIFHTSIARVWEFLSRFCELTAYRHKVLARHGGRVYAMPINLFTINALFGREFTPEAAREFVAQEVARAGIAAPANLAEKAISQVGRRLYEAFIRDYTRKQWARAPEDLPAEIINRLPVRYSYDISYFGDKWQGVPAAGYGRLFANMANHPLIELRLNCEFAQIRAQLPADARVIYTGLPDALFKYEFGELQWRSLRFEWQTLPVRDFQGTSVMNYSDLDAPFTRIHEFKHYNPERGEIFVAPRTVICREYPADWARGCEAYYPIPSKENMALHARYAQAAARAGIILGGRLGGYKYLDMDKAMDDAMRKYAEIFPS